MSRSEECAHCGRSFEVETSVGRPRRYCRRSCRQRAFEARRYLEDVAWGDARVTRLARQLAELEDRLDRVTETVDELRADLADGVVVDLHEALDRLQRVSASPPPR